MSCNQCFCETSANRPNGLSFTNYNDRCIKAKLQNTEMDGFKAISSIVDKATGRSLPVECIAEVAVLLADGYVLESSYEGKSQVNIADGDVFDLDLGYDIAKNRCLDKYHKDFDALICKALERARTLTVAITRYCEKHKINIENVPSEKEIHDKVYLSGCKAGK